MTTLSIPPEPRRDVSSPGPLQANTGKTASLKEIPAIRIPKPVPNFHFDAAVKANPPNSKSIFVIAPGSEYTRYGFAGQSNPQKLKSTVAYRKKERSGKDTSLWKRNNDFVELYKVDDEFDEAENEIGGDRALTERRRGRGRPIPWFWAVDEGNNEDTEVDENWSNVDKDIEKLLNRSIESDLAKVLIGDDLDWIPDSEIDNYDVVSPIADSHLNSPRYGYGLARAALDALIDYAILQIFPERKKLSRPIKCETHVLLIVPENATRRDIAEYCASIFRCQKLAAAAVFIHHQSVTCALGAGLASCTVIDIGHTGTSISCIDEGTVIPDSRVRLAYGGAHVASSYQKLLEKKGVLKKLSASKMRSHELRNFVIASGQKICGFNTEENDAALTYTAALPQGQLRLKCGVGFSSVPAWGLFYPRLFTNAVLKKAHPTFRHNTDDDNYFCDIFDDLKRSTVASAALPIGTFSNDATTVDDLSSMPSPIHPLKASLSDAVVWSINKAAEVSTQNGFTKQSDLRKRLFGSILLAGGGSNLKGLSLALENRLKAKLSREGTLRFDVTVFDGRGKVDEELAAAAAVVKGGEKVAGLDDDGDSASLSWKGGAVIAQAEATGDMWIYRDEWEARHVRAVRERVPFYW